MTAPSSRRMVVGGIGAAAVNGSAMRWITILALVVVIILTILASLLFVVP